jgi:hypothetical protein
LTTGGADGTAMGPRLSNSSLTPPIGSSSNGMGLPGPDFVGQMGVVQEEGGPYCAGSNSGRQPFSLASRLSQQALSEIKDRWGYVCLLDKVHMPTAWPTSVTLIARQSLAFVPQYKRECRRFEFQPWRW